MKNLIKFNVIFLVFFIIFSSQSIAADRILPIPKPIVDQETKIITAKKKEIYPQKKPVTKKVKAHCDYSRKQQALTISICVHNDAQNLSGVVCVQTKFAGRLR